MEIDLSRRVQKTCLWRFINAINGNWYPIIGDRSWHTHSALHGMVSPSRTHFTRSTGYCFIFAWKVSMCKQIWEEVLTVFGLFSFPAGYWSARVYKVFRGKAWVLNSLLVRLVALWNDLTSKYFVDIEYRAKHFLVCLVYYQHPRMGSAIFTCHLF